MLNIEQPDMIRMVHQSVPVISDRCSLIRLFGSGHDRVTAIYQQCLSGMAENRAIRDSKLVVFIA